MKKILFFLMMLTLSCIPWATRAQSINVSPSSIETGAGGYSNTLTVTYDGYNVSDYYPSVQFYGADGTPMESGAYSWLSAYFYQGELHCGFGDNPGLARTAYFRVVLLDRDNNYNEVAYSNLVTVSQAANDCPAPDHFSLTEGSITTKGGSFTWTGYTNEYSMYIELLEGMYSDLLSDNDQNGRIITANFDEGIPQNFYFNNEQYPIGYFTNNGFDWSDDGGVITYTNSNPGCIKTYNHDVGTGKLELYMRSRTYPTIISFEAMLSAGGNNKASFWIDGIKVLEVSGGEFQTKDWAQYSFELSANNEHTLKWEYTKNDDTWYGDDALFLDDIIIYKYSVAYSYNPVHFNSNSATLDDLGYGYTYRVFVKGVCPDYTETGESNAVVFTTASNCQVPDHLTATNLTGTSADIRWAGYGYDHFDIFCANEDLSSVDSNRVYEANSTLTGLSPHTTYKVWLKTTCETSMRGPSTRGITTITSDTLVFTTSCGAALPYFEDFENCAATSMENDHYSRLPECWNSYNETDYEWYQGYPTVLNTTVNFFGYPYSGERHLCLKSHYANGESYDYSNLYAIMPAMGTVAVNTLQLSFYACRGNDSHNNVPLYVGVMSDPTDINTFDPFETIEITGVNTSVWGDEYEGYQYHGYNQYTVDFSNYTGEGKYIAFMMEPATSSYEPKTIYIDDINCVSTAVPSSSCNITLELTDSFGDGWSGNAIEVIDNQTHQSINTYACSNYQLSNTATTDTIVIPVTEGQELQFLWVSGGENSFPSECSWVIKAFNGDIIIQGSGSENMQSGQELTTYPVSCSTIPTPPSCEAPVLTLEEVTPTSFDLSWTDNNPNATSWQYVMWNNFDNPSDQAYSYLSYSGLSPNTTYDVYVRSVCGEGDYSNWSSISITTAPAPEVGDFWSDDFDGQRCGWEFNNYNNQTNKWVWSSNANNGGSRSIYISNNYVDNTYTNSAASTVYAYRLLNFGGGEYTFEYDWRCVGESNNDYFKVMLAPRNVYLAPGTLYNGLSYNTVPNGWIAVGTYHSGEDTWQRESVNVEVPEGMYNVVIVWHNNDSDGSNPPAAIDNFSITLGASPVACEPITITENNIYTENFESPVVTASYNSTTDLQMPACWGEPYAKKTSGNTPPVYQAPHLLKADAGINGYNYSNPASQVLYFYGDGYGYVMLPEFTNPLNELQISFKWATESITNGILYLGYITANDENYNSFKTIKRFDAYGGSYQRFRTDSVYLYGVPDTAARLAFYWYANGQWGANIDDIKVSLAPTCPPLLSMGTTAPNPHTIAAAWLHTEGFEPDAYVVRYGIVDDPEQYINGVTPEGQACIINNLCSDSLYYIHVRAYCGGDDFSEWTTVSQRTPAGSCSPVTNLHVNLTGNGTNSAKIYWTASESTTADVYDIHVCTVPVRDLSTLENGNCEFPMATRDTTFNLPANGYNFTLSPNTTYYVYVRTRCDMNDGNSDWAETVFTTLPTCRAPQNASVRLIRKMFASVSWEPGDAYQANNYMLILADHEMSAQELENAQPHVSNVHGTTLSFSGNYGETRYIYVANNCDNDGNSPYVYAGSVTFPALCPPIQNLTASNITANTVQLSWNRGEWGEETQWYIERYLYNSNRPENSTVVNDSTVIIFGLQPETTYSFQVQAKCSETTSSIFSNWVTITTLTSADLGECPGVTDLTASNVTSHSAHISWMPGSSETQWNFLYSETEMSEMDLFVAEWDRVQNINLDLENLTTGTTYHVYVYPVKIDSNTCWNNMRHISFTTTATCLPPTNVAISNITSSTATVSWEYVDGFVPESGWIMYLSTTPQFGNNNIYRTISGGNDMESPFTIRELQAGTTYYLKMQSNCRSQQHFNDFSTWTEEYSFTTPCDAIVVDAEHSFTENFDTTAFPPTNCWSRINSNTHAWSRVGASDYNHSGAVIGSAYSSFWGDVYLVLPDIALANDANDVSLSFWSKNTERLSYTRNNNSVVLLDGNSETVLWSPNYVNTEWTETTIDLNQYKGQTIRLAFKHTGNTANPESPVNGWYLDDITIAETTPTDCPDVTNLTAELLGNNLDSVKISWAALDTNFSMQYEIFLSTVYGPDQDSINSLSNFTNPLHGTNRGTIRNYVVYGDLEPNTQYYAYVRRWCTFDNWASVNFGDWATVPFTTLSTECPNVTNLTAELLGNGSDSVKISWAVLDTNFSMQYEIFLSTVYEPDQESINNLSNFTNPLHGTNHGTIRNYVVYGDLEPNTQYYAYVRRWCTFDDWASVDFGNWSSVPFTTLEAPYTITYMDGNEVLATANYIYGEAVNPMNAPSKEGYTFIGWYPEEPATMPNHDEILYAQWQANKYNITINQVTGGTITVGVVDNYGNAYSATTDTSAAYNAWVNLSVEPDAGYTFGNYVVTTASGIPIEIINSGFVMPAEDVNVSATFTLNTYTVTATVDPENAGSVTGTGTYNYNTEVTLTATPATGYSFDHWQNMNIADNVDSETANPLSFNVTEDVTYKAFFSMVNYELVYMDGEEVFENVTYNYGDTIDPISAPEKEGYTFIGWNPAEPVTMPAHNDTVNAQWKLIPCLAAENLTVTNGSLTATSALITWSSSQDNTFGGVYYENGVLVGSNDQLYQRWNLSGLQPNSNYRVGVFAYCSLDRVSDTVWVEFTTNDTCYPPVSVSISDVTAHSAKLSYAFVAQVPGDILVNLSTDPNFASCVHISTTTSSHPESLILNSYFNNAPLQPNTTYHVRMSSLCDRNADLTSVWSETLSFTTLQEYAVTIDANITNGTVTVSDTAAIEGAVVNLTATPNHGYSFGEWVVTTFNTPAPETITVTNNSFVMPEGGVNVSATFIPNRYVITYKNGNNIQYQDSVAYGTAIRPITDPTREGYTFTGWVPELPATMPAYDVTVHAQWNINKYVLTYMDGNDMLSQDSVEFGADITPVANPTKEGYTFNGWDPEVPSTMPAHDVTVTAIFTLNTYTVTATVNPANAGTVTGAGIYNYGSEVEMRAEAADGYLFTNWTNTQGVVVSTDAIFDFEIANDTAFTAHFTAMGVVATPTFSPAEGTYYDAVNVELECATSGATIHYTTDGSTPTASSAIYNGPISLAATSTTTINAIAMMENMTNSAMASATYTVLPTYTVTIADNIVNGTVRANVTRAAEGVTVNLTAIADEGYHFAAWNVTTETGAVEVSANNSFAMPAGNVTISATFEANEHIITYMDGNTVLDVDTFAYGATITPIADPTKEGYSFTGWNPALPTTMPDNDVRATAQWSINRYALTYMDGNIILSQDSVDYGAPITPIVNPTKEGYTFTGWNPQLPQTMPANDMTVNAQWELIPCMAAENLAVASGSLTATSAFITWNSSQDNTYGGVYYENGVLAGSNNQLYQRWSLSELQPGTNYRVGVFAYCSLNRVSDTVWVEFTTNDTCYPPVSVSISDVTAHSALLSYDFGEHVPNDFMVHISTDPDFAEYDGTSTSTDYRPNSMPLSSLVGLNLQSGTTYYVRMASQCHPGLTSVWSETLSFTTLQEYAVSVDADITNGTVSADVTVATAGTVVNLTATPDNGYSFGEWVVTTVNTPAPDTITVTNNSFVMPASEVIISATFTPNSYNITVNQVTGGTITVAEAGATAGSTTNTTAKYNAWVQLNAVADNGYTFSNFVVTNADGSTIETPNNGFIMPANDVTVTAIFNITPAELSWSAESFTGYTFIDFNNYKPTLNNPHNVSVRYGLAEDITNIVVNPETGYITNSFDVPSLITAGTFHIYAVHETDPTYYYDSVVYTLNVNWAALVGMTKSIEEGGNITFLNAVGNLTHAYSNNQIAYLAPGTSFTTTATANEGYHFVKWQIGNDNDGYTDYATTDTVVYTAPTEITSMYLNGMKAVFDTNTYVLNVVSNNNEMGSVNGNNPEAKHFLSYEISATPNAGYHFLQWNDGNTDNPRMVSLTEDATYEAFFGTADFELVYMNGEEIFETITYTYGETINPMSAPEREGYIFIGWAPAEPTTMPAHNDTLYAQWELIPCMAAENLAVANGSLTATSALITWSSSQDNTFGGVYYENGVLAGSNNQLYQRWNLSDLQPNSNYRVGVFAYCSFDRVSDTVWVEFTTNDTCYPPVSVSISDVTAHSALLSYDFGEQVPGDFIVYIATNQDFDNYIPISTSTAPDYFPTSLPLSSLIGLDLQSGTTYYVKMSSFCSINPELISVWSETISFTTLEEYTVTIDDNIANGTVTADVTVAAAGTVVNLTATPDNGYSFGEWIVTTVNTPAPEIVTVTNNSFVMPASEVNISATFTPNSYNITLNPGTGGTIVITINDSPGIPLSTTAEYNSVINIVAVPHVGYSVGGFVVTNADGSVIPTPDDSFIMPANDVTITGNFIPNEYTITYMDGNTVLAVDTFTYRATVTPIADPTKEGYTFTGWNPALPTTMPDSSLTVDAQWQINSYNITLNQVTGGTITVSFAGESATSAISTTTDTSANFETWIQLSEVTDDGYTFVDFLVTDEDGEIIETPNNGFIMPASDVTVTATFSVNNYTITYLDGNSILAQDTVAYGATITPIANPTKVGYTFTGWNPALPTTMPANDLTVNAQWQINSYNITINQVTGGTITASFAGESATSAISTTTDTSANFETWIQLSEVTLDGYTFGDFVVTTADGTPIETPNNGFIMPASDVTVTATFSVNNYTITYMDGNTTLDVDTFAFGTTITPIANPTREGYTFTDWNPALPTTMPANDLTVNAQWQINSYNITINQVTGGTITVSFAGESATSAISTTTDTSANFESWIQLSVVTDNGYTFNDFVVTTADGTPIETPNNGFIMPASDVTVTATFSVNNYTITYMDGNTTLDIDTFAFGTTITPIANPTREGYTFTDWNPALPTTMPANDLTVNAQWQINSYNITINQVTGGTITVSFAGESATSVISTTTDTSANFETWIQLSADADYAYDFVDFVVTTASGDTLETPNNGFIMPAENVTVTAIFTLHYFNVTVNVSEDTPWGTITGGGSFVYGSTDTLTATPMDEHHIFVGWSDFNTENPRVITVTQDSSLTAYFVPEDIEIISNDTLMGGVNVNIPGGGHLTPNTPIVITAVPEPHYHFVSWSDGNTDNPRTILPIQAVGLTAIFAIDQHTVTVLSNDDNMGMVDGSATVDYGSVIQISATAYTGYTFISWNDGNTENPRYITVECDTTFTATFQLADGIEDANMSNVNVYSYNDQVVIANAEGFSVEIFDMSGRLIVSENSISQSVRRYTINTDGIYLVKVGNNLFKKVKIAR